MIKVEKNATMTIILKCASLLMPSNRNVFSLRRGKKKKCVFVSIYTLAGKDCQRARGAQAKMQTMVTNQTRR